MPVLSKTSTRRSSSPDAIISVEGILFFAANLGDGNEDVKANNDDDETDEEIPDIENSDDSEDSTNQDNNDNSEAQDDDIDGVTNVTKLLQLKALEQAQDCLKRRHGTRHCPVEIIPFRQRSGGSQWRSILHCRHG